ncbi:MAG: hypothetical protein E7162_03975 [Firmicutes bacterium]|nr:hypothetical protein [Bacillota bacterium]
MILIPKKGCSEIKYDSELAKKLDYVIIVNDVDSSNVGDLFSIWNQKCKVTICNDITDYYDFIKKEKKFNPNLNIMIIGTKNTSYETLLEYKNLTSFYFFYQNEVKKIEKEMSKWNKTFVNKKDNVLVKDAMSKFVFMNSNGKYLRALLIALGYFIATKKDDNSYLPLAAAYETFQTSILIHDDVIDNAELRRGKKTIHKKYEEKFDKYDLKDNNFDERKKNTSASIGICAGDIGFFIANNMIVESYMSNPNLPRVLKYYNDIVINTGKGELIDVVLPFNEQYYSKNKCLEKDIMEIYDLKTSWYTIVGPCSLGMILGGNSDRVVESMVKTLSPLGTAFQIKDDILGIYGSIKNIGKSNTSDISEFKQTLLYSYVVNNTDYKEELRKYYGKEELTDQDLSKVREIFEKSGARDYAIKKMDELFKTSKALVLKNRNIPTYYKEILLGFITYLELREN